MGDLQSLGYNSKMTRKPAPKPDDAEQSKRFIETAEEVGADDEGALERALKAVVSRKSDREKKS